MSWAPQQGVRTCVNPLAPQTMISKGLEAMLRSFVRVEARREGTAEQLLAVVADGPSARR